MNRNCFAGTRRAIRRVDFKHCAVSKRIKLMTIVPEAVHKASFLASGGILPVHDPAPTLGYPAL